MKDLFAIAEIENDHTTFMSLLYGFGMVYTC